MDKIRCGCCLGSWTMLPTQNKCKKLGPFSKICNLRHSWLLTTLQKRSTSLMPNFLNFDSLKVFLDFLESLICPLRNTIGLFSIWYSMFMYEALTKKSVFVDFSKWPIMSKFITSCACIFRTWELKMNCRIFHPLQNELWMGYSQ